MHTPIASKYTRHTETRADPRTASHIHSWTVWSSTRKRIPYSELFASMLIILNLELCIALQLMNQKCFKPSTGNPQWFVQLAGYVLSCTAFVFYR